jgi:hypothetical protein
MLGRSSRPTFPLKGVICYSKADIQWETVGVDHTAQERAEMEAVFDEFEAPVPLIL